MSNDLNGAITSRLQQLVQEEAVRIARQIADEEIDKAMANAKRRISEEMGGRIVGAAMEILYHLDERRIVIELRKPSRVLPEPPAHHRV